jgi:outer membrane protein assembly factor BamB
MKNLLFIILLILISVNLNSQTPDILWTFDVKSTSFGNSCADDIDGDGKLEIVFSTYYNDEFIYALNSEDGSILWKYYTKGCNDAAPLIVDVDNDGKKEVLLHSSSAWKFYCFNGKDGSIKWMINTYGTDSPPSFAKLKNENKSVVLTGDFAGILSCYNAVDGSLIWKSQVDTNCTVQSEPVIEDIDNDGDLDCVVGTWSFSKIYRVSAYRIKDGKRLWTNIQPQGKFYHGASITDIDSDGKKEVIIGCYDGVLYCFNGTEGSVKWTFNYPDKSYIAAPTSIADIDGDGLLEIVIIANTKVGVLSNLGKLKWTYDMGGYQTSFRGPVLSDLNNDNIPDILFGSLAGKLITLNGITGKEIFNYNFTEVFGKRFDIDHAPLIADFNSDGLNEIFFIGGYTEYPAVEKSYGKAYMLSTNQKAGMEWKMFRYNLERNAVINQKIIDLVDSNLDDKDFINVYFNQNLSQLEISTLNESDKLKNINIFNSLGQCLIINNSIDVNKFDIDVSNLNSGVYFINIQGSCIDKTYKFIKI